MYFFGKSLERYFPFRLVLDHLLDRRRHRGAPSGIDALAYLSDSLHQEFAGPRSRAGAHGKRLDPRRQLRGIGIGLRLTELLDRIFEYVGKPGESNGSVDDRLHL